MRVTYQWLKEFVGITLSPQELAERLTMAGLEVVSLEKAGQDHILEIEITSNRPDWLSVAGVAREVAALTGKTLTLPLPKGIKARGRSGGIRIVIENKKDCPLYTAKVIEGVKVGPSPEWMRRRLEAVGCRSINNVVDITNYVLFERGQPLHAFDADLLGTDTIVVRRAARGETIPLIDGAEKALDQEVLVIADRQRPVAIAGVMGGKATEVTEKSTRVLLEAAVFNPVLIRRGRRRLGMQTDSSYRFERGVDIESAQIASARAALLIQEIAGGRLTCIKSAGVPVPKRASVTLSRERLQRLLGAPIPPAAVKRILTGLGFQVRAGRPGTVRVGVPLFRQDVAGAEDLVEEVARVYGYARLPSHLPALTPKAGGPTVQDTLARMRQILTGLGLSEVITYSLIDRAMCTLVPAGECMAPEIANPLSQDQEVLRPTLIPSLLRCIGLNLNQKQGSVRIFEIAKTFSLHGALPRERLTLGVAVCGVREWVTEEGRREERFEGRHIKGIVETLGARLHCPVPEYTPVGFEIKGQQVFAAELDLEKLLAQARRQVKVAPLPRFPAVVRDISFVVDEALAADEILRALQAHAQGLLREARIVDFYQGRQIPAGKKNLTVSCSYRSDEHTLTEEEVLPAHEKVLRLLTERFHAAIR